MNESLHNQSTERLYKTGDFDRTPDTSEQERTVRRRRLSADVLRRASGDEQVVDMRRALQETSDLRD